MSMGQLLAVTVVVTKPRIVFEVLAHIFQWFVVHLVMLDIGFSLGPLIFYDVFAFIELIVFITLGSIGDRCVPKQYQQWYKRFEWVGGAQQPVSSEANGSAHAMPTMGTNNPLAPTDVTVGLSSANDQQEVNPKQDDENDYDDDSNTTMHIDLCNTTHITIV